MKQWQFPLKDRSAVGNFAIWLLKVISIAGMIEVGLCRHALLDLDKGVKLAPAILANGVALRETQTQGDGSLVEHKVDVFLLLAAQITVAVW